MATAADGRRLVVGTRLALAGARLLLFLLLQLLRLLRLLRLPCCGCCRAEAELCRAFSRSRVFASLAAAASVARHSATAWDAAAFLAALAEADVLADALALAARAPAATRAQATQDVSLTRRAVCVSCARTRAQRLQAGTASTGGVGAASSKRGSTHPSGGIAVADSCTVRAPTGHRRKVLLSRAAR